MVSNLDLQTWKGEFEFYWVLHSFSLVPHLSKKLSKLLLWYDKRTKTTLKCSIPSLTYDEDIFVLSTILIMNVGTFVLILKLRHLFVQLSPCSVLDWFGLIWSYRISTIVGYLMPNPLIYILHKNATCNLKQVLAATPHKTPTVRPPAPYHENYSS